jgi:hypothetical protein
MGTKYRYSIAYLRSQRKKTQVLCPLRWWCFCSLPMLTIGEVNIADGDYVDFFYD